MNPIKVFISYTRADREMQEQLVLHMAALKNSGQIEIFLDREGIQGGDLWEKKIATAIEEAQIMLCLITPRFIASEYVGIEMNLAKPRAEAGDLKIVPVLMKRSDFGTMWYSRYQAFPPDGQFISKMEDPDDGYLAVVHNLKKLIASIRKQEEPKAAEEAGSNSAPTLPPDSPTESVRNASGGGSSSGGSNSSSSLDGVKDLVSAGKIGLALERLQDAAKSDADKSNQVILLQSRWNGLRRNESMGVISAADASMQRNRITHAVLSLVDDFS